mmetsp:Transcript_28888/g.78260  ORF Transcript_28888/g.78260 Transcript_28888/m.78260 type:complete len:120 (-) Transcript_28888:2908-3267(-)
MIGNSWMTMILMKTVSSFSTMTKYGRLLTKLTTIERDTERLHGRKCDKSMELNSAILYTIIKTSFAVSTSNLKLHAVHALGIRNPMIPSIRAWGKCHCHCAISARWIISTSFVLFREIL